MRNVDHGPGDSLEHVGEEPSAAIVTWIDDAALLAEVEDPACLVVRVRQMVAHAQAALAYIGVDTNFGANKTEVMLVYVGKQGKPHKAKWLSPQHPTLDVELVDGSEVQVVITPHYQHVGGIVEYTGEDTLDVDRTGMLARNAFRPLYKKLLFNPHLTCDVKRALIKSMVGRKLLHAAGHWVLKMRR